MKYRPNSLLVLRASLGLLVIMLAAKVITLSHMWPRMPYVTTLALITMTGALLLSLQLYASLTKQVAAQQPATVLDHVYARLEVDDTPHLPTSTIPDTVYIINDRGQVETRRQ